jgi:predicted O-methyltransferase YrrM
MTKTNPKGLHDYYEQRDFKPTFAGFKDEDELEAYDLRRQSLYRDLLHLPPRVFEGARLCEFGPDTGENALVFARWGARVTLVEPHASAWPEIRAYFARYGLDDRLEDIVGKTIESFESETRFDFINAEGFIYTVQPNELWLSKFKALLRPDGFAVVNYLDRTGCLFELLWSLAHARYQEVSGERGVDAAWSLFEPKWNSIHHTRPFESWVKDVLENPFVRLKYLIDPVELSAKALKAGLALYASWPRYENPFHPYWHKNIPGEADLELWRREFITRSRVSFAFARPLFTIASAKRTKEINDNVLALVGGIDHLIDGWGQESLSRAKAAASQLVQAMENGEVMAGDAERREIGATLGAIIRTLDIFNSGDAAAIRNQMRTDSRLLAMWGSTTHYAVFRLLDK